MSLYLGLCVVMSVLGIALTFASQFIVFTVLYVLFYASLVSAHSQMVTVLADVVALEELPYAIALSRTFMGTTTPPAFSTPK